MPLKFCRALLICLDPFCLLLAQSDEANISFLRYTLLIFSTTPIPSSTTSLSPKWILPSSSARRPPALACRISPSWACQRSPLRALETSASLLVGAALRRLVSLWTTCAKSSSPSTKRASSAPTTSRSKSAADTRKAGRTVAKVGGFILVF